MAPAKYEQICVDLKCTLLAKYLENFFGYSTAMAMINRVTVVHKESTVMVLISNIEEVQLERFFFLKLYQKYIFHVKST